MLVEADSFAWALPIAVVLLPAMLAVFYGLATALARLFWTDDIGRIAALAASFALLEWLRTFLFTGFPWNPIGYAAMPMPLLMQSVAVVGMVGHECACGAACSRCRRCLPAIATSASAWRWRWCSSPRMSASAISGSAWPTLPPIRSLPVRIVQPSIDQATKLDKASRDEIFRTLAQSHRRTARPRPAPSRS